MKIMYPIALLCITLMGSLQAAEISPTFAGLFEGQLVMGREDMNLAFTFSERDGTQQAAIISSGLGIYGLPADYVNIEGVQLVIRIPQLDAEYTGILRWNAAGDQIVRIDGEWFQSAEMVPVVLLPVDSPTL